MNRWPSARAWVAAILGGIAGCGVAESPVVPVTYWEATLSGANVIPPVTTTASGSATLRLNGTALDFTISVSNLVSADSARVYIGNVGQTGPVAVNLCGPCTPVGGVLATGTATTVPGVSLNQLLTAMRAFGAYLQVRDASGPVLRGQLRNTAP